MPTVSVKQLEQCTQRWICPMIFSATFGNANQYMAGCLVGDHHLNFLCWLRNPAGLSWCWGKLKIEFKGHFIVQTYAHTQSYMHAHTHTIIHAWHACACTHTYILTQSYTCTHTHTYMCTHTPTHTLSLCPILKFCQSRMLWEEKTNSGCPESTRKFWMRAHKIYREFSH